MDIILVFLISLISLAIKAIVVLVVLFQMLKYADKKRNVDFQKVLEKMHEDPKALAHYYGRRVLAASIAVAGIALGSLL